MQTVRSYIIVAVHKHAEVAENVARQDSGALFYVHMKVDVSTMICFRLLLLYSKPCHFITSQIGTYVCLVILQPVKWVHVFVL